MGKWFPALYDIVMKPLENRSFKVIRKELIHQAKGKVLEIGAGTGINFPLYENVEKVDAIEPSPEMIERSKFRKNLAKVKISIHVQSAEELNFKDSTFDTVIATLVFCTIPDPVRALTEIQRVLKPGGKILFFEHVKMNQPYLARMQELLTPTWKKVCDGCHLNRDTLHLIYNSGLQVEQVKSYYKGLFLFIECTKI